MAQALTKTCRYSKKPVLKFKDVNKLQKDIIFDKEHIWHPYSSATNPVTPYMVKEANGCKIKLENGTELIDGMSSWWAAIHGYNHTELNKAVFSQIKKMSHIMFGGFTHEPAIELSRKLIDISDRSFTKVFYSDSGSVSVEVAMKMAVQYWQAKGRKSKNKFVTIKGGYHGDTWNAMSVCDPITGMHNLFSKSLPKQYFAERPKTRFGEKWDKNDISSLEKIINKENGNIAALILEPIVQGAGGMWFYSVDYLKEAVSICKKNDILIIFDEIATGFGRTGELFAMHHSKVVPDILCVGKALTGGYMTLAATLCNEDVAESISNNYPQVFMHGPTFMANPLACSVALANINLLINSDWKSNIKRINKILTTNLLPLINNKKTTDVRILGAIGVVEMKEKIDLRLFQEKVLKTGVWLRPFGKLLYTMPPFIISDEELIKITEAFKIIINNIDE